jgi:hypothetical protein
MTVEIRTYPKAYYEGQKVLDGNTFKLLINWNTQTEKWYLSITGLTIDITIRGIALLPGRDLFAPFGYGEDLGQLWVIDGGNADENPNYAEMGSRWTLQYTPLET